MESELMPPHIELAGPTRRMLRSFKVKDPVAAPFTSAGRSSALHSEDKYRMEAWVTPLGVEYKFPDRPQMMTPWSNVIECTFAAP
jgi:hypothetical protein